MLSRNNSIISQPHFSVIKQEEKQEEENLKETETKSKTFRLIVISILIFTGVILILVVIFGALYGSALVQSIALKKNFTESCLTYKCDDSLQLICLNQICSCSSTMYWNGYSCASFP